MASCASLQSGCRSSDWIFSSARWFRLDLRHAGHVDRPARDPVCALLHEQGRSDPALFLVLLAFMGAMLGIIVSGNVILLSIFWELTSIFSFLLISYWHTSAAARDGARMALTITGMAGSAC